MKLYDGSEVIVYNQAPGQYVYNIMLTADDAKGAYWNDRLYQKVPLCTIMNGGFNAGVIPDSNVNLYPEIMYRINDRGYMTATMMESPTFTPVWSGTGYQEQTEPIDLFDTDYGKWYWNVNYFD